MAILTVRNEDQHRAAMARIDELWESEPGTEAFDEFDGLVTLVDAYERKLYPRMPSSPVNAILFRLEQMEMTRKDLEPLIGTRARVSEILTGRRSLSLDMIRALHDKLKIPLESLIAKPEPVKVRRFVDRVRQVSASQGGVKKAAKKSAKKAAKRSAVLA